MKKKALNAKRKKSDRKAGEAVPADLNETHDEGLAEYLQSTLSMIEGRTIGRAEIQNHLRRWNEQLRQQGLQKSKKIRILRDD